MTEFKNNTNNKLLINNSSCRSSIVNLSSNNNNNINTSNILYIGITDFTLHQQLQESVHIIQTQIAQNKKQVLAHSVNCIARQYSQQIQNKINKPPPSLFQQEIPIYSLNNLNDQQLHISLPTYSIPKYNNGTSMCTLTNTTVASTQLRHHDYLYSNNNNKPLEYLQPAACEPYEIKFQTNFIHTRTILMTRNHIDETTIEKQVIEWLNQGIIR